MIRCKNEITEKEISKNVNSQIIKPMAIRMLIGLALIGIGGIIVIFTKLNWLGYTLAGIGAAFAIMLVVMYFIVRRSAAKQNNLDKKIEYEYRFDPRFFSVTVFIKGKKQGVMNLNYQDIAKYKETKTNFYIYLTNKQTLIVSKTVRYPEGSPEALHKVLKERTTKKKFKKAPKATTKNAK